MGVISGEGSRICGLAFNLDLYPRLDTAYNTISKLFVSNGAQGDCITYPKGTQLHSPTLLLLHLLSHRPMAAAVDFQLW